MDINFHILNGRASKNVPVLRLSSAGAGGVVAARFANQQAGGGAIPTSALQSLRVAPVPIKIAKELLVREHYLRSMPGGTLMSFGVFLGSRLLGALTLGAGPANAYRLVDSANPSDCAALTRLWLSDELPGNSESRVLGVVLRSLRTHTRLKFLITYADPAQGHLGTVYQASGWLYIGLSQATPKYDLGDGKVHHSRSLAHAYGTRSVRYLSGHGVAIKLVDQPSKHRYVYFLDESWRAHLRVPVLDYPRSEAADASD